MTKSFNTPSDLLKPDHQQSLGDLSKPLLLAAGIMTGLFLTAVAVQVALISSQTVLLLLVILLVISVVLVFLLVGFVRKYKALQMRLDLISTGIDLVTGLPDSNEFSLRADIECRRCAREFTPLTMMYIGFDIDSLEDVDAIRVAQNLMNAVSRPGDMVAKVDETTFGLILPSTNEMAQQLADRCLKGVTQLQIHHPVSIGLCTFQPTAELDYTSAMRRVNHLLIRAKADGGNKVCADAEQLINPSVTYSY